MVLPGTCYPTNYLGRMKSILHPRIQIFSFMKESVSFQHPIISTGLKYLTPMFLSIETMVRFVFNACM